MDYSICEKESCTGCGACKIACKKRAIYFRTNVTGTRQAFIKQEQCISCGLCKKVCHINNRIANNYPIRCYAARSKDLSVKKVCASGGIASTFGLHIVKSGGNYYGVGGLPPVIHECKDAEMVLSCANSKYVESLTGDSYTAVREAIYNKKVVYVGAPCQVAGLISFLGDADKDNLITVDFTCHGMPPYEYLLKYIEKMSNKKADNIYFRDNDEWKCQIQKGEETLYYKDAYDDEYMQMFLQGVIFRDNCYHCFYANSHRVSDITVCDFWGINREGLKNSYDGNISAILINSEKGKKYFEDVSSMLVYEERPIREAIKGNTQLYQPSMKNEDRLMFEQLCQKDGWNKAFKNHRITREIRKRNRKKFLKRTLQFLHWR